ncbi:MAG: hypothetical protein GEU78_14155 [Actinobacteria bacterium]|nr:hypothetical protein [Actinomycetota bacterium]
MSEQKRAKLVRLSDVQLPPDMTINPTKLATIIRKTAIEVFPREWHVLPDGRATHSVLATEILKRMD